MIEHCCDIPNWKCYGNDPIFLESVAVIRGYPPICVRTEINYCPFCGFACTYEKKEKHL